MSGRCVPPGGGEQPGREGSRVNGGAEGAGARGRRCDGGLVPRSAPSPRCHPGAPPSVDRVCPPRAAMRAAPCPWGLPPTHLPLGVVLRVRSPDARRHIRVPWAGCPRPSWSCQQGAQGPGPLRGSMGQQLEPELLLCAGLGAPRPLTPRSPCGTGCGALVTGGRSEAQRGKATCAGHTAAGAGAVLRPARPTSESEPGPLMHSPLLPRVRALLAQGPQRPGLPASRKEKEIPSPLR